MGLADRRDGTGGTPPPTVSRLIRRPVFMLRSTKWRYPHPPEPEKETPWPGENLPKPT